MQVYHMIIIMAGLAIYSFTKSLAHLDDVSHMVQYVIVTLIFLIDS